MGKQSVRITNRTRGTLLGGDIRLAGSWFARLRGLLGAPEPRNGEGLLLVPCNAIHTYGMSFPLDVLFLSEEGRVVQAVAELHPGRRTERVNEGVYVLELPVGTIARTSTQVGDEVSWAPAPARRMNGMATH